MYGEFIVRIVVLPFIVGRFRVVGRPVYYRVCVCVCVCLLCMSCFGRIIIMAQLTE